LASNGSSLPLIPCLRGIQRSLLPQDTVNQGSSGSQLPLETTRDALATVNQGSSVACYPWNEDFSPQAVAGSPGTRVFAIIGEQAPLDTAKQGSKRSRLPWNEGFKVQAVSCSPGTAITGVNREPATPGTLVLRVNEVPGLSRKFEVTQYQQLTPLARKYRARPK
jgi:hypothetical protein